MEYTQTYSVNRLMHLRPCGEASKMVEVLQREYSGLGVILQNERTGSLVCGFGVIKYMTELQPLVGDRIRITLNGDFPRESLVEGADLIGKAFSSFKEIPQLRDYFFD